ncbi:MAG: helix-turn-helix domain-containing protein [Anditalea sp.]
MKKSLRIDKISQFNDQMGVETLHPLVSVINFDEVGPIQHFKRYMGVYAVFLKDVNCGNLLYGCQHYDYEEGILVFAAPGQIYGIENEDFVKPAGYALLFHPDLIHGTALGQHINNYTFFHYEVSEALHLSKREREAIIDCFNNITFEIKREIDSHSKTLIVSYIELFLNYCMRFYDRQFITRTHVNSDILVRFEKFLGSYFESSLPQTVGLPSVSSCAEEFNLSANYFGDLIKKETGKTAQEHIRLKLIDISKEKLFDESMTISEIAYQLGFKYPAHFTRIFKKEVGYTPNEFRMLK